MYTAQDDKFSPKPEWKIGILVRRMKI